MHIKLLYRKVLYVFLSLMIIFANTQTAYAASAWNITGAVSAGARTVVSATKSGYKSAVNIAPTAGRLALRLAKFGRSTALIYAVNGLLDGIDWVLDPANNTIKYKEKSGVARYTFDGRTYYTLAEINQQHIDLCGTSPILPLIINETNGTFRMTCKYSGANKSGYLNYEVTDKTLSMPQVAAQVAKNAAAGHAPSQDMTRETAVEMVVSGDFDRDLLAGAVPINDNKPLVPSVPISGNGNQGYGGVGVGDGADDGMSGATPGAQSDAAKDAAEAAKNAADAAKDAAKAASEQAAKDAADAQDLINSGADQAAVDAANDRAKAAEQAAKNAKDVADAAVEAADARAKAAEKAAQKATEAAKEAAAKAAKDVADAKAAGDDAAVAAAEKAKEAAEKAVADAKEKQAAAERAADKAKAEAAKPFELPAFCSWASVVCDYTKWVKDEYGNMSRWLKEEPTPSPAELMPIDDDTGGLGDIFKDKANAGYVSFQSQCPDNVLIPVSLMGASQTLNISYAGFCHFASLIRPAVILGAWISGLLIISGGRARE